MVVLGYLGSLVLTYPRIEKTDETCYADVYSSRHRYIVITFYPSGYIHSYVSLSIKLPAASGIDNPAVLLHFTGGDTEVLLFTIKMV